MWGAYASLISAKEHVLSNKNTLLSGYEDYNYNYPNIRSKELRLIKVAGWTEADTDTCLVRVHDMQGAHQHVTESFKVDRREIQVGGSPVEVHNAYTDMNEDGIVGSFGNKGSYEIAKQRWPNIHDEAARQGKLELVVTGGACDSINVGGAGGLAERIVDALLLDSSLSLIFLPMVYSGGANDYCGE